MAMVVEFLLTVLVVDGFTIYRSYNKSIEYEQDTYYSA
jgi:hypothetical protein